MGIVWLLILVIVKGPRQRDWILINDRDMSSPGELDSYSPEEIITWAAERYKPQLAVSSSFQMQSLPLLHMIANLTPDLPVIFLDTGYHFPETLLFRDQIVELWGLNLRVVRAQSSPFEQTKRYGPELHRTDPDFCCHLNKVEPMQRILRDFEGWISGIRRDQSPARAHIPVTEQTENGVVRIHPLASWTRVDIWRYIHHHNLPTHPLFSKGYFSIGCVPCTRPLTSDDEDERAGRWSGLQKTECGLHIQLRPQPHLVDSQPDQ